MRVRIVSLAPLRCRRAEIYADNLAETPGWYIVCEYYPPGNVVGDNNQYFIDNVKKQVKGKASDTVESGVTSSSSGWRDVRWGVAVLGIAGVVSLGIAY